jgi:Protein of unknown function (DUF3606)
LIQQTDEAYRSIIEAERRNREVKTARLRALRLAKEETIMADDRTKKDKRDRNKVAADEGYEVEYLAEKTGISRSEALGLIHKHGNNRETLLREARKLKG